MIEKIKEKQARLDKARDEKKNIVKVRDHAKRNAYRKYSGETATQHSRILIFQT